MKRILFFLTIFLAGFMNEKATAQQKTTHSESAAPNKVSNVRVKIRTDMGTIIVRLYDETPLHRDNFIHLVQNGFYDSLLFHRVIPEFMIQGGDPGSKHAEPNAMLGSGGGDMERIPAEFRPNLFHKRGALAAARDGNPQKASSACQFYLVQGKKLTDGDIQNYERMGRVFTEQEKKIYMEQGGTPFLDQNYTVFGEIESGMEVVDKIAASARNPQDRPNKDVRMFMEILK